MHKGSCLCGAVAFSVSGPLRDVTSCHCSQCRKTSGHYWAATGAPIAAISFSRDDGLRWYRSSGAARARILRGLRIIAVLEADRAGPDGDCRRMP